MVNKPYGLSCLELPGMVWNVTGVSHSLDPPPCLKPSGTFYLPPGSGAPGNVLGCDLQQEKINWRGLCQGALEKGPSYYRLLVFLQTKPKRIPTPCDGNFGRILLQRHSVMPTSLVEDHQFLYILLSFTSCSWFSKMSD